MENVRLFIDELDGSQHIIIQTGENAFISMTKAHFDELEAAKENGTTLNGGLN